MHKSAHSNSQQPRDSYRISEAAERLGVSHWTVRRLIRSGAIRSVRILRVHLIPVAEIERLLKRED